MALNSRWLPTYSALTPLILSAVATVTLGLPAKAQSNGGASEEEIIVTARKREERLQDVPATISAVTGKQLQDSGVRGLRAIAENTSGLSFVSVGGSQPLISMRGDANRLGVTEPGVGVFIDGVYVNRQSQLGPGPIDAARVEILKGPQSTLYGKNTAAGAINIISNDPTFKTTGLLEVGAGLGAFQDENIWHALGVISGPIIEDKLAFRLTVASQKRDGYVVDRTNGTRGLGYDTDYVRFRALAYLSEDVTWRFTASYRTDHAPRADVPLNRIGAGVLLSRPGTGAATFGPTVWDWRSDTAIAGETKSTSFTNELSWDTDWGTLTSLTNFQISESAFFADPDATQFPVVNQEVRDRNEAFSQELRLSGARGGMTWLAGAYYLHEDAVETSQVINFLPQSANFAAGLRRQRLDFPTSSETFAGFAQFGIDLSDSVNISAGLRYAEERKFGNLKSAITLATGATAPGAFTLAREATFDSLTGNITLSWTPESGVLAYATVGTGNKSGGFSAATSAAAGAVPFDEQDVTAYEAGVKTEFMDRRVRINLAGFYNDYKGLQFQQTLAIPLPGGGSTIANITRNAADSRAFGLDAELHAELSSTLSFNLNYTYLDAEIERYDAAPGVTLTGIPVVRSPKHSGSITLAYTDSLGSGQFRLAGSFVFKSDFTNDIVVAGSSVLLAPTDGYGIFNLQATYDYGDWGFGVYVNNVFNEEYIAAATILSPTAYANSTPGEPRTFEVTLKRRF